MDSSDPEAFLDQVSNLPVTKETVLLPGLLYLQTDLLLKRVVWMIRFSAEAILASSTSKFGIEIPRFDDDDLKIIH